MQHLLYTEYLTGVSYMWSCVLTGDGCSGSGRHRRPPGTAEEGDRERRGLVAGSQGVHAGHSDLAGLPTGWDTKQGQGVSQGWGPGEGQEEGPPEPTSPVSPGMSCPGRRVPGLTLVCLLELGAARVPPLAS